MGLALVVLTVVVAAPHPIARSQTSEQAPATGKTATVTGCLARGVEPKTFVLKNVAWQSSNASSPEHPQDSQPASSTNTPSTTETLRLAGAAATLGLEAYVGHTVSASGALARTDPPVSPGSVLPEPQGDSTSKTRAAEEQAAASLRIFDMRSVTDVAGECR